MENKYEPFKQILSLLNQGTEREDISITPNMREALSEIATSILADIGEELKRKIENYIQAGLDSDDKITDAISESIQDLMKEWIETKDVETGEGAIKFLDQHARLREFVKDLSELHQCEAEDCEEWFMPDPRGAEQRFCSEKCRNRIAVRRWREKKRVMGK